MGRSLTPRWMGKPGIIGRRFQKYSRANVANATAQGLQAVHDSLETGVADYVAEITRRVGDKPDVTV